MANSKTRAAWDKIKNQLVKSDIGIIPVDSLARIMKTRGCKDSRLLEEVLSEYLPHNYDTTGFCGHRAAVIGFKYKTFESSRTRMSSLERQEVCRWENPENATYVREFCERNEVFEASLKETIIATGNSSDRLYKQVIRSKLLEYSKKNPQAYNAIVGIVNSDRKFLLAMNQYAGQRLHPVDLDRATNSTDFYLKGFIMKPDIVITEAIPIPPWRFSDVAKFSKKNKKGGYIPIDPDRVKIIKIDEPTEVEAVKPIETTAPPKTVENPKAASETNVRKQGTAKKEVAIKPVRQPIEKVIKDTYKTTRKYMLMYTVEFVRWLVPNMLDTGLASDVVGQHEIMLALKLFAKERGRNSMIALGPGSLCNYLRELDSMYEKATDLPVKLLCFDTMDGKIKLPGIRLTDDLRYKLHPDRFGKVLAETKPQPNPVVSKVEKEPVNITVAPNIKEVVMAAVNMDVNKNKRALAIEASKMALGMIDGEEFLSEATKKSLVTIMDKHGIRDMILYTKLSDDKQNGQVAIRLVKDEYFGDFDLVSNGVSPMRRINIAAYTTKRPALTINVPKDSPASIVYKEDLEPWGYSNGEKVVAAVISIIDHYMSRK